MAGSALAAIAQDVPVVTVAPVTVGAITRDVGLYTGPGDANTMKGVNRYLTLIESALAEKVSSMSNVSYQDRTATGDLLRELRISSGRNFDPTSGSARGLLGRLNYLIVIDALDPATAKMRLIDVETGSVQGVETCSKGTACVNAMARRIETVVHGRGVTNADLAAQRADIMTVKPAFDDQVARYEAAKDYWANITKSMQQVGGHMRPDIQTLLNGAATDVQTGQFAVQHLDVPTLKTATSTLTDKLDRLDQFR